MSETSETNETSETQNRKKRTPIFRKTEFLTLAEVVELTGWSPEEVLDRCNWGYLLLMFADEPRTVEIIIDDYSEHRKWG